MNSEDLIRHLCIRAIRAEGTDFEDATADLHSALKMHIQGLRAMAAAAFLGASAHREHISHRAYTAAQTLEKLHRDSAADRN